jgi:uncharacterized protein (AIM24 family)
MMHRAETVKMTTGTGGCCNGCKRTCAGESFWRNTYTNKGQTPAAVCLAPAFPSKIFPLDLSKSGTLVAHPGLYLGHLGDVQVTFRFISNIMAVRSFVCVRT